MTHEQITDALRVGVATRDVYSPINRFWARVSKGAGCWEWTGPKDRNGYGKCTFGGRTAIPHRLAYEFSVGPIPDGLEIDHLCRNRTCCNPDHLEAVTRTENNRRSMSWGGINHRKTHCPYGHPYDEANTYVNTKGRRECRTCLRARWARRNDEQKEARRAA